MQCLHRSRQLPRLTFLIDDRHGYGAEHAMTR